MSTALQHWHLAPGTWHTKSSRFLMLLQTDGGYPVECSASIDLSVGKTEMGLYQTEARI